MSGRSIKDEVGRVHLENPEDINVQKTEEKEPEHFVFRTFTVANNVAGYDNNELILALDPLRKEASILAVDRAIVLCHSRNQLTDPANQVTNVPNPQGAYLPANAAVTVQGTGRVWAVATSATPTRITVIANRRTK